MSQSPQGVQKNGHEARIQDLLSMLPPVCDAVARIPGFLFGVETVVGKRVNYVDSGNSYDVCRFIATGCLQLELDALAKVTAEQLGALVEKAAELRDELDEIKGAAANAAAAAERGWTYGFPAQNRLVFINAAGRYAQIPTDLAYALHSKSIPVDCTMAKGKHTVTFRRDGKRLARIPKSLFSTMGKVLATVPWNALSQRAGPSNGNKEAHA